VSESSVQLITTASKRAAPASNAVPVGDNRVRLLRDGAEAYPAMLAAISASRTEILLEMYWFGSDAVGRLFVDALAERARAGVTVRVVFDAIGSAPVDPDMFDELRMAGADVRAFNPLFRYWRRAVPRWMRRDHRKLLVCDDEVGFTGGLNIGRPWAARDQGGEGWRDDVVEVTGPGARELRALFYETWRRVLKRRERADPKVMPTDAPLLSAMHPEDVWVIANQRRQAGLRAIRGTYLRWIAQAKKDVEISNAYFVPDFRMRRALIAAVRRGVRVRVLVPEVSDLTFVQWAVEATLERLTKIGVQAYAYRGAVLHAKTAVVDDDLVTIGSYNLDARSFRYNLEANLAVRNPLFATVVRRAFEEDFAHSIQWTYEVLRSRGFLRRWMGELMRLFARFL
jgi:cardiolipin synthase